jgi:hypothetical protein
MMTLLSSLLSFLAGGVPRLLDIWQDSKDKAHELQLAQLQMQRELEMAKEGFLAQQRVEEIRTEQVQIQAQADEIKALYAHDIALGDGVSQWVKNLRALVRPVITYGMFALLVFVDVAGFWYAWTMNVPFDQMLNQLWDDETQQIWAAIIAFHFGSRAFAK